MKRSAMTVPSATPPSDTHNRPGVGTSRREALSRDGCLRRLRTGTVARVAVTVKALPRIELVRYYLIGEALFIDLGSAALARRLNGHVVAFENGTSESDPPGDIWSVCAVGVVTSTAETPSEASIVEMHPQFLIGWVEHRS